MVEKTDINNIQDVKKLVDIFYLRVRGHILLAPIFEEKINEKWPEHLDKMYRFWQTVLLSEHTYYGSPFPPHAHLPVDSNHFNAWKELFNATIEELFKGPKAEEAKLRAFAMAEMFLSKINYSKNNSFKSIQ
ncbi:MAG: group hemoglobin [Daejeonella sp.]|nr:group hemoglobin [Daejeonella sp.]